MGREPQPLAHLEWITGVGALIAATNYSALSASTGLTNVARSAGT